MALGKNVKTLRLQKNWTLKELSQRSTVPVGTISAIEVRDSVRSEYASKLALALGVSTDDLITGQPPSQSTDTQPSTGIRLPATGAMDIAAAIETVAQALSHLTTAERVAVLGKIGKMDDAFDSASLKQSIVDNLLPSTAGKAVEAFAQEGKKAA